MKKKPIIIFFVLIIFVILFANFVSPACPRTPYDTNLLRGHLRTIVLNYLSDPTAYELDPDSYYDGNEIRDLLQFYKDKKNEGSLFVDNCDVEASPSLSNKFVSTILRKTVEFITECNDGVDNDGDRARDLDDSGCTSILDEDETNCGDGICEASSESCSSCSADCGVCPIPAITIMTMKSASGNAISFNDYGDAILKGSLQQNVINPSPTGDDEFIFIGSDGNTVAIVNIVTGNMEIKGILFRNQASLSPSPGSDFIVKKDDGSIVSYIDNSGNLYLKGFLTENGNP
tara:strand:+ start:2009 stop:2872 length:864 start_codon:yes stop_codon:yes gene_type:complete